jgi:hypothetical protein
MTNQELLLNPYDVLEVSQAASANEIAQAFMKATKQRKYPIGAIAAARRQLMNPEERLVADYFRPILPTTQRLKRTDFSALESEMPTLELLSQFDGLDLAIFQSTDTSELDQRLGTLLFSKSPVASSVVKAFPKRSMEALRSEVAEQVAEQIQIAKQTTPVLPPPTLPSQALIQTDTDSKIVGGAIGIAISMAIAGVAILWGGSRQPQLNPVSSNSVSTPQASAPPEQPETASYYAPPPKPSPYSTPYAAPIPSPVPPPSPVAAPSPSPLPVRSAAPMPDSRSAAVESTSQSAETEIFSSRTPEDSCGDRDPGSDNITWYPVFISYSERNLKLAKNHYCRDAIKVYREEQREVAIQVASFVDSSDAARFANFLKTEIGNAEVGEGSVYRASSPTIPALPAATSSRPAAPSSPSPSEPPRSQPRDFSFPMASCGDQISGSANTLYPVFVYHTAETLTLIRRDYCGDAFRKNLSGVSSQSNELVRIQVASFLTRRDAETFSEFLGGRFNLVEIGDPHQF